MQERRAIPRMDFKLATPTEGMPHRWTSENGVWELGLRPMLYGVRVSAGTIEEGKTEVMYYSIDYCAGSDQAFLLNLLAAVFMLLCALPEEVTGREVEKLFPTYERKPINLDPCWDELMELCKKKEPFPGYAEGKKITPTL